MIGLKNTQEIEFCYNIFGGGLKTGLFGVNSNIDQEFFRFIQDISSPENMTAYFSTYYLYDSYKRPSMMFFLMEKVFPIIESMIFQENENLVQSNVILTIVIFMLGCLLYTGINLVFIFWIYSQMKENLRKTLKLLSYIPHSKITDDQTLINMISSKF